MTKRDHRVSIVNNIKLISAVAFAVLGANSLAFAGKGSAVPAAVTTPTVAVPAVAAPAVAVTPPVITPKPVVATPAVIATTLVDPFALVVVPLSLPTIFAVASGVKTPVLASPASPYAPVIGKGSTVKAPSVVAPPVAGF